MKKIGVLFIVLVLFSLIFIQVANAQLEGIEQTAEDAEKKLEEGIEQIENIESKWDYLGKEWKKIFLKNKVVSFIDGFFTKISFVFVILFAQPYTISITLLFIIIVWLFFLFWFAGIFDSFSMFDSGTSLGLSLAFTVILSQLGIFKAIVEGLGWIFFAQKGMLWRVLSIGIYIGIFYAVYFARGLIVEFIKGLEERKKKMKEALKKAEEIKADAARKALIKAGEAALK